MIKILNFLASRGLRGSVERTPAGDPVLFVHGGRVPDRDREEIERLMRESLEASSGEVVTSQDGDEPCS